MMFLPYNIFLHVMFKNCSALENITKDFPCRSVLVVKFLLGCPSGGCFIAFYRFGLYIIGKKPQWKKIVSIGSSRRKFSFLGEGP